MNRVISGVVLSLLTAIGMGLAGYFQSRGFVAIGDARIPSTGVAWLTTIISAITGLTGGKLVPWTAWISKLIAAIKSSGETPFKLSPEPDGTAAIHPDVAEAVDAVPTKVEHLHRCVYHLRSLLRDDADAQDWLDKIAVKVGRVTSGVGEVKP